MKLGITGGIGSGKTSVCRVFNVLGIPVFSADAEAREIMDSDPEIIEKVKRITGTDLYASGSLARMELAGLSSIMKIFLKRLMQLFTLLYSNISEFGRNLYLLHML